MVDVFCSFRELPEHTPSVKDRLMQENRRRARKCQLS